MLDPYEEIRGRLESVREDDSWLHVELSSGTLAFRADSKAAEICKTTLNDAENPLVSILKTPDLRSPIRINIDDPEA